MKLLLISDHENSFLWDYYVRGGWTASTSSCPAGT